MRITGVLLSLVFLAGPVLAMENVAYFQKLKNHYGTIADANSLIENLRQKNKVEIIVPPPQYPLPERPIPILTYEADIRDVELYPDPEASHSKKARKKKSKKHAKMKTLAGGNSQPAVHLEAADRGSAPKPPRKTKEAKAQAKPEKPKAEPKPTKIAPPKVDAKPVQVAKPKTPLTPATPVKAKPVVKAAATPVATPKPKKK